MAAWQIRACLLDEAHALLDLWQRCDASPSNTDNIDSVTLLLREYPDATLIAELDGTVIGSIIATFDGWRGNLYRLAVDPLFRRQGLAHALVEAAESRLRRLGARRVTALVEGDHPLSTSFWDASPYRWQQEMRRYYNHLDPEPE